MTQENDLKRPTQELEHKPIHPVQNEAHYENEASSKAGETLKILTACQTLRFA